MLYSLAEGDFCDEEGVNHKVYGISATDSNDDVSVSYPDMFFDRCRAECLVNLCNKNKLELCHLPDIIEDVFT